MSILNRLKYIHGISFLTHQVSPDLKVWYMTLDIKLTIWKLWFACKLLLTGKE